MNGMEGIFGIIGIGAGLYSLYAWFQLKFKGIINTSILVPKDTNNTYVQSTGKLFWVMLVLVLAVLVWFAWTVKKLNAKYF